MYIEDRFYSDYEDEVLYSVVLDEDPLRLYSEFQERYYGLFGALAAKTKGAFAGVKKKANSFMANASDGILHDNLTNKFLNKAVKEEGRQAVLNRAASINKAGAKNAFVDAKEAVSGAFRKAATSTKNAAKSAAEATSNAYHSAVNAGQRQVRGAQVNLQRAKIHTGNNVANLGNSLAGR